MTKNQENRPASPDAGTDPRPSQTAASTPQTDRSPAGPDKERQVAQEPQQSTGLGTGQS